MTLFKTTTLSEDVRIMDRLRHQLMRALLDERGRLSLWMYGVRDAQQAFIHAYHTSDIGGMREWKPEYKYAFVGPKVQNIYFVTAKDLQEIVLWVCGPEGPMPTHRAFSLRDVLFRMGKEEAKLVASLIVANSPLEGL